MFIRVHLSHNFHSFPSMQDSKQRGKGQGFVLNGKSEPGRGPPFLKKQKKQKPFCGN